MHVTYLALSSVEEPFASHRLAQQSTWANSSTNTFWLLGDGPIPNMVKREGSSLVVGVPEKFENILEKTILSIQWCLESSPSDFYVRTNTSTYISDSALRRLIARINPIEHYAAAAFGRIAGNTETELKDRIFLAGNMMVFSKKTAELVSNLDIKKFSNVPDDVAMSLHIQSYGVEFTELERNDLTDYKGFKPCIQHRVKSWSDSDVTIKRMHEVHKVYTSDTITKLKTLLLLNYNEILRYRSEFPLTNVKRMAMNLKNCLRQTSSLIMTILFNSGKF